MKFIIAIIITALLSFASCLFFPWWSIAGAAFIVALFIHQSPLVSFSSAFLSLFLLWSGLAFYLSSNNDHLLAHKVSLIILKTDNPILLIVASGIIGGLVAGFAALIGSFLRKKKKDAPQN